MPWTWDDVKREWLGDSQIAYSQAELVDGFNQAEEFFGPDWVADKASVHPGGRRFYGRTPDDHDVSDGQRSRVAQGRS